MKTLREKFTLTITGLIWLTFHVRTGPDMASILSGTFAQIMLTAPYSIGFTYITVIMIRYFTGGSTPPWDRIIRIFFTIGIFFAFFFALYEYGDREEKLRKAQEENPPTVSRIYLNENQKVKLYWA
ncbi:MAG: hypothetical protein L3J49_04275 [Desulfobulbaceae bacterium]|nr:hypothetical protein [Desulfobulbaceae bacterium]